MRYGRVDNEHGKIRQALRAKGAFVFDLSQNGNGCPDLLVALPDGNIYLIECKSPYEKLSPHERQFHEAFPAKERLFICENVREALFCIFGSAASST